MVGSCLGWPKDAVLIATRSYSLETCYRGKMIFDTLFTFSQIRRREKTLRRKLESMEFRSRQNMIKYFCMLKFFFPGQSIFNTFSKGQRLPPDLQVRSQRVKGVIYPFIISLLKRSKVKTSFSVWSKLFSKGQRLTACITCAFSKGQRSNIVKSWILHKYRW